MTVVLPLACTGLVQAEPISIPEYQVGETARVDIITPVSLMLVDRAATESLRSRESQKIPVVFQYQPGVIQEAEANLRGTFGFTREEFMENLELAYKQRKLAPSACAKPRFAQFVANFKNRNRVFPLNTNLAEIWATGKPDEPYLAEWVARLRQVMEQYIRPDNIPTNARLGSLIRIVTVTNSHLSANLETLEKQSTAFYRSNLVALKKVRADLQAQSTPEVPGLGKFLGLFVRENCLFDEALTRQKRDSQTESLWAADSYEPGQVVLRRGEVVTARAKAALEQMRAKTMPGSSSLVAEQARLGASAPASQLPAVPERYVVPTQWLIAVLVLGLASALFSLWRVARWKRSRVYLPVHIAHPPANVENQGAKAVLSCPTCAETIVVELPALHPATRAPELAAGTVTTPAPNHLGRLPLWLQAVLTKAFHSLLWQRAVLLDTQKLAEMEVRTLEKRLAKMKAPLQERIQAYETRIADLEKELSAQQEQNAELLKAQIALARKRLETERQKAPVNN